MNRNIIYEEKYAYTLKEFFGDYISSNRARPIFNEDGFFDLIYDCGYTISAYYKPSFIVVEEGQETYDSIIETLFNQVLARYQDHYFYIGEKIDNFLAEDYEKQFARLLRIADYTYPKYKTMLDLYESQKSHLMDKLAQITAESSQSSQSENHSESDVENDTTKINDTPQDTDVQATFEGNQYVSELHKAQRNKSSQGASGVSGSGSVSRQVSSDPSTIIERLHEIDRKYNLVMFRWVNEFDKLFIEEGNV